VVTDLKVLLRDTRSRFESAAIDRVDAELILAHVLGIERMQLHAQAFQINSEQEELFEELVNSRISGVPTQYLIGEAPFRYLTFSVGPGVLIPRPETELLVDAAMVEIELLARSALLTWALDLEPYQYPSHMKPGNEHFPSKSLQLKNQMLPWNG
jgi:methylase of polypeptide subunit release factors